jgi:hypothetical protein
MDGDSYEVISIRCDDNDWGSELDCYERWLQQGLWKGSNPVLQSLSLNHLRYPCVIEPLEIPKRVSELSSRRHHETSAQVISSSVQHRDSRHRQTPIPYPPPLCLAASAPTILRQSAVVEVLKVALICIFHVERLWLRIVSLGREVRSRPRHASFHPLRVLRSTLRAGGCQ